MALSKSLQQTKTKTNDFSAEQQTGAGKNGISFLHKLENALDSILFHLPESAYEKYANRKTLRELEKDIHQLRSKLDTSQTSQRSHADREKLERIIVPLEKILSERQEIWIDKREEILEEIKQRKQDPYYGAWGTFTDLTLATDFFSSLYIGLAKELPYGEVEDSLKRATDNLLDFGSGYIVGYPTGLGKGIKELVEFLGTMLGISVQVATWTNPLTGSMRLMYEGYQLISNEDHRQHRTDQVDYAIMITKSLYQFGNDVADDPTIIYQLQSDFGFLLGEELAQQITNDFLRQKPHEQGKILGELAGSIAFEVLIELVLAATTGGVGNLLKSAKTGAKVAKVSGKLKGAMKAILESSPALRKLLKGLEKSGDVSSSAKLPTKTPEIPNLPQKKKRLESDNLLDDATSSKKPSADNDNLPSQSPDPTPKSQSVERGEEAELPMAVGDNQSRKITPNMDPDTIKASGGSDRTGGKGNVIQSPQNQSQGFRLPSDGSSSKAGSGGVSVDPPNVERLDLPPEKPGVRLSGKVHVDTELHDLEEARKLGIGDLDDVTIRDKKRSGVKVGEDHHIATHYGKIGDKLKKLFKEVGIDIHHPINIIENFRQHGEVGMRGWVDWTKIKKPYKNGLPYQFLNGHHPGYHQWVLDHLEKSIKSVQNPDDQVVNFGKMALKLKRVILKYPEVLTHGSQILPKRYQNLD